MTHVQKPNFVFRWNGRVHLIRRGRQFCRQMTAELCASVVVMLDTQCSEVVWRVLAAHSIRQFPLHFPSRASPCAITFQLDSTKTLKLVNFLVPHNLGNFLIVWGILDSPEDFSRKNLLCVPRSNAPPTIRIRRCQSFGLFCFSVACRRLIFGRFLMRIKVVINFVFHLTF
jgi:hypothetical protein